MGISQSGGDFERCFRSCGTLYRDKMTASTYLGFSEHGGHRKATLTAGKAFAAALRAARSVHSRGPPEPDLADTKLLERRCRLEAMVFPVDEGVERGSQGQLL